MTLKTRGRTFRNRLAPNAAGVTLTASRAMLRENEYAGSTATITAVVGRTVYAANSLDGPRISFGERDYLIPASAYTIGAGGAQVEPEEGDKFIEEIEGTEYQFVCSPVAGEPAWRYSDSGRTLLRVHVKRVTDWTGR